MAGARHAVAVSADDAFLHGDRKPTNLPSLTPDASDRL